MEKEHFCKYLYHMKGKKAEHWDFSII